MNPESPTVLTSPRLRYQRLSRNDAEAFHLLCLDEQIRRHLLDGAEATRVWVVEAIELSDRLFRTDGVGLWMVWCHDTPVGFCGFRVRRQLGAEPQLLCGFTGDRVGGGEVTEATEVTEVTETMVAQTRRLGWPRVVAAVDQPDDASVRALEQAGFAGCGRVPGVVGDTLLFERFETPPPARLSSPLGTGWALKIQHTWDGDRAREGEAVSVALELGKIELSLQVDAPFYGDPPPDSDDLWTHEVVELMLVGAGETYLEVELSPHGHHLVLFLRGERNVVHRGVALDYGAKSRATGGAASRRFRSGGCPSRPHGSTHLPCTVRGRRGATWRGDRRVASAPTFIAWPSSVRSAMTRSFGARHRDSCGWFRRWGSLIPDRSRSGHCRGGVMVSSRCPRGCLQCR